MSTSAPTPPTDRFKIINRETAIIAAQLTSALETVHQISKSTANYYLLFYSLSMSIERLMKLIIHIERPELKPKEHGHQLKVLSEKLDIYFTNEPIVQAIFDFLNGFAMGERYTIVGYLHYGNRGLLNQEPIVKFYRDCLLPILSAHPPKSRQSLSVMNDIAMVMGTKENLKSYDSFEDWYQHGQDIAHASKFLAMYVGRLIQPYIHRLILHEGHPLPYFSEYFVYLRGDDKYFKSHKIYRSK